MSYSQVYITSDIDNRLMGNPQVTYFKSVYRRHTSFYKGLYTYGTTEHTIVNDTNINKEDTDILHGTFDLINDIFIEHKITGIEQNKNIFANLGNSIIHNIQFWVGQVKLYEVEGLYMEARSELDNPFIPSMFNGSSVPPIMQIDTSSSELLCNTGNNYNINSIAGGVSGSFSASVSGYSTGTFYTKPNFYFCKDNSSSFPICALNHTDTNLKINYRNSKDFMETSVSGTLESTVNIEFINLSNDERLRFINDTEPYIYYDIIPIDYGDNIKTSPIRQLFFIGNHTTNPSTQTNTLSTPWSLSEANINLTGIDLQIKGESIYENKTTNLDIFTKQNIYRNFPGYGRELSITSDKSYGYFDSIGVHCFCLDQSNIPSGHLNSNMDFTITFSPNTISDKIKIYAEVIKFFYITGGQGGLLYT